MCIYWQWIIFAEDQLDVVKSWGRSITSMVEGLRKCVTGTHNFCSLFLLLWFIPCLLPTWKRCHVHLYHEATGPIIWFLVPATLCLGGGQRKSGIAMYVFWCLDSDLRMWPCCCCYGIQVIVTIIILGFSVFCFGNNKDWNVTQVLRPLFCWIFCLLVSNTQLAKPDA